MNRIFLIITSLFIVANLFAQAPQKMSYQAVIRNNSNTLITSAPVGIRISILQGSASGTAVYVETHATNTNANGLVSLEIGAGAIVTGSFASIDWSTGPYFIQTETDPTGGTTYTISGTSELLSVPYALSSGDNKWATNANGIHNIGSYNVGVGSLLPYYKLDVEHGGSTGIRAKSTSSFSVIDIDGASGDAALRFAKAGVNQWNTRNRPADDYYEIFELGGGGSRFVIQDGTGNVGIGETNSPSYRLDVLHGGSTGIRSRSSGSFSVVDIDAASGDAALRFAKAGTNQWNLRNRPSDNYFEIFELGGGGSRFVIQDSTGYIGIGSATTAPTYQLDIEYNGSYGLHCKSNNSSSIFDIDAFNGDAALRLAKAGASKWVMRNNPANDNLQFFEFGAGERMRIDNTTGKVWVNGDFTALGVKAFTMDHPLDPENKMLVHAAVESNEVMNLYSGNIVTDANGKATVILPDYFEAINKDFRYQLTVIGAFAQAIISKEISNNRFEISTNQPNVKVSWEVKGVRNDARMQQHPFIAVQEKTAEQKGKYVDPEAHQQPLNKAIGQDDSSQNSTTIPTPTATKKTIDNSGGSTDSNVKTSTKNTTKPAFTEKQSVD